MRLACAVRSERTRTVTTNSRTSPFRKTFTRNVLKWHVIPTGVIGAALTPITERRDRGGNAAQWIQSLRALFRWRGFRCVGLRLVMVVADLPGD